VRFGLFGTGHWAEATQGAALAAHPSVELVGVWGRDPAKAAAVAALHGARPYPDIDALLADVDAVAVALPPDIQAPLAVRAAEAGRHLLLDKPLAFSVADADAVVSSVDRAGVASLVFFTSRFVPDIADFLGLAVGQDWYGARITMCGSIFEPDSPYRASRWRMQKGGLWDLGPHALSMVLPVLGPVREVVAMSGRHESTYVLVRHDSGAVSQLELSVALPPEAVRFEYAFSGPSGLVTLPSQSITSVEAFGVAIDELLALVAGGSTAHPCDVRFGRDVVAILAEAEHSVI
jgi:predicted dehydrogenase